MNLEPTAPLTVALYNLGCRVNRYESDAVRQQLLEAGYHVVDFSQKADIYIVNTCAVTAEAARKSGQMLRRAKKLNPAAVVVGMGCLMALEGEHEDADLNLGNKGKSRLVSGLKRFLKEREGSKPEVQRRAGTSIQDEMTDSAVRASAETGSAKETAFLPEGAPDGQTFGLFEEFGSVIEQSETRAFVKVQDGCNQFCAYCTIPLARGRVCSRAPEQILAEVEALARSGFQEVTLTGIHVCSYGLDFGRDSLALLELCEKIAAFPGIRRIRFGSVEPLSITKAFIARFSQNPKLCHHLHLSLQSGSDTVLKRMRRRYDSEQYRAVVRELRRVMPGFCLTTDVIVGFPGETEAEHRTSLDFCESLQFAQLHVFRYSPRPLTAAASFPDPVPAALSERRSKDFIALSERSRTAVFHTFIGSVQSVLLEQRQRLNGRLFWSGYTAHYLPVRVEDQSWCAGEIVELKLLAADAKAEVLLAEKAE